MTVSPTIVPYSLRDAPALIEKLLPVQKLSAEAYKEQMAGIGKTLTALGNYWKGRKPLILAKACVLGCLLPATEDLERDLEIFEMLMGMDALSLEKRLEAKNSKESRFILAQERSVGHDAPYREWVRQACRTEECGDDLYDHIWGEVNAHLGTDAGSFPELVEQLGVMRFGHRPRVADTFCGSGQIPFEAARLGCDVYASDLNPVACMLTWGAFNIVGGSEDSRARLSETQQKLVQQVQGEIDRLGVETDGRGWRAKVFLYCVETRCPQTGWMVPLLPTRVISKGYRVIAELVPDPRHKRYEIVVRSGVNDEELEAAETATVRNDGRGQDQYLVHAVNGIEYRTKISTLRGDYRREDGSTGNALRMWEKTDFRPHPDDIFQERLYAIQWMRPKSRGAGHDYEFRAVTEADLARERVVDDFVAEHLADWQEQGWTPDMRIEPGVETERLYRERGWTHWHHLWNARHLLTLGVLKQHLSDAGLAVLFASLVDYSSRLSRWETTGARLAKDGSDKHIGGASNNTKNVFYNQALNTFYNFGCRSTADLFAVFNKDIKQYPIASVAAVDCISASDLTTDSDLYIRHYHDLRNHREIGPWPEAQPKVM